MGPVHSSEQSTVSQSNSGAITTPRLEGTGEMVAHGTMGELCPMLDSLELQSQTQPTVVTGQGRELGK